jgi:hypothetical protein
MESSISTSKLYDIYLSASTSFDGDIALFWAGRMSEVVYRMNNCRVMDMSECMQLLYRCKVSYDQEIFRRVEE